MAEKKERLKGPQRKEQIIQAAISIMTERGLSGTTTRLIAEKVGISEPALYRYFPRKKDILLEALDEIGDRPLTILSEVGGEDEPVPQRILKLAGAYYEFVTANAGESMLFFEVLTGSRDPEIREALGRKFVSRTNLVAGMFEAGKRQGSVREDLDTKVAAWQILSLGITLVFAFVMGLEGILTKDKALLAVEELMENIVSNASAADTP
ncbi:MAG: TetR/AcrR family transcriptional regulator [Actinomycetota bacterium]|nr:TetR/AcrR family transcriptional regulator [Actinomycetota bacterium]